MPNGVVLATLRVKTSWKTELGEMFTAWESLVEEPLEFEKPLGRSRVPVRLFAVSVSRYSRVTVRGTFRSPGET